MSLTGKNTLSIRRKDVQEQKSIAIGFKKIQFAHKATIGATQINLNSLVLPSEMSGFTNPSPAELLAAQISFYRKNLTLVSSTKGVLIDYMSYNVSSDMIITFVNFTADDGEVFTGVIDAVARTGVQLVDAAPLVSTGELAIAAFDFNVGQLFEINKYSSSQVGAVIVYRNGAQQFRNTSNSAVTLDGNYYEVNNGSGTGQVIRFNTAPSGTSDSILVVSNGLMAYNPDGSALQRIEAISGKIDSMVPTVAALAGVPESNFGGVTNVDLKSFGDSVLKSTNILAGGTTGQVLQSNGPALDPSWSATAKSTLNITKITSSSKTPSATNNYHSISGNSIALAVGTWELTGIVSFGNGGTTPTYTDVGAGYYGANGADSSSQPTTTLSGVPNLTIDSAYGGSGFLPVYNAPGGSGFSVYVTPMPTVIVTVTASVTVYLVTYSLQTTSANARITTYFSARQLY